MRKRAFAVGLATITTILLTACGGSSSTSLGSGASSTGAAGATASTGGAGSTSATGGASSSASSSQSLSAAALSAEAASTATGDIPDNQVFLTFHDKAAGYALVFPEGWAQRGSSGEVTFQQNNNIIHVVVLHGSPQTPAQVTTALAAQRSKLPSLAYGSARTVTIGGARVVKISYSTLSAPNQVTGKRVQLLVDRYVYFHAGKVMVLDLATAKGVDNVDAYRKISQSVRWS